MAAPKVQPAIRRDAVVTWRTSIAGKRLFQVWCKRRRLDMSEVNRLAVKEFMENHKDDYPIIAKAD